MLRKFSADRLFTGYTLLGADSVLVTDENGVVQDIVPIDTAGEGIEKYNGIICPGFVNCHCHLELSHMHDLVPRNSGMIKFLLAVMSGRQAEEEKVINAMQAADNAMKESGIVAVGDICNTADSIRVKSKSALLYHNFIEVTGFTAAKARSRFDQGAEMYAKFLERGMDRVSIVPHSPYSVSEELFELINAHQKGSLLSIHNQESIAETEFFTTGKGEMLELYKALGIDITHFVPSKESSLVRSIIKITGDHSLILVHNVNTSARDLKAIHRGRNLPLLFWCLCPAANVYINNELPDVVLLKNYNCKIVVGTDSLASNDQLNILEELKILQERFGELSTAELLRWATLNGAEALRIDEKYGTFENGKQPGVVNISGGENGSLAGTVSKRIL
ncbi:MAG: amidohydrolase family protein [Chitinophagaceae bacterium]|nr:amidohydrolase family protein [Chitinophagaceae bacterium]